MSQVRKEFKIGIAGCGRISQAYVQALQYLAQHGRAEAAAPIKLTAVMDSRLDVAQSTAEAAGCKAFGDLDEFIREGGMDGAIICAPPNAHRPIALELMRAGVHVLCEKPLTTRYEDAVAMKAASGETGRVLMMASKFRYVEDIVRAKAIVASGMLGDIMFYENNFCSKVNMSGRWNANPEIAGGGVLIDNGTHSVDVIRYILGDIQRINAREGKRVANLAVEDTASISAVTEKGAIANVYLSWSLRMDHGHYISIHGTEGQMKIGFQESKYQYNSHPEWIPFGVGYNKIDAFKRQVVNFVETIRETAAPIITMDDGLKSVELIEAAYRSMERNQWIEIRNQPSENVVALAK